MTTSISFIPSRDLVSGLGPQWLTQKRDLPRASFIAMSGCLAMCLSWIQNGDVNPIDVANRFNINKHILLVFNKSIQYTSLLMLNCSCMFLPWLCTHYLLKLNKGKTGFTSTEHAKFGWRTSGFPLKHIGTWVSAFRNPARTLLGQSCNSCL